MLPQFTTAVVCRQKLFDPECTVLHVVFKNFVEVCGVAPKLPLATSATFNVWQCSGALLQKEICTVLKSRSHHRGVWACLLEAVLML